jgi:hypothetical protein
LYFAKNLCCALAVLIVVSISLLAAAIAFALGGSGCVG